MIRKSKNSQVPFASVGDQLIAKMGRKEYGAFLDRLHAKARASNKRRKPHSR